MGVIIFNGKPSNEYGIHVEHFPDYEIPEKDYDIIHVPGKSGDIVIDNGSYKNVSRTYVISSGSEEENTFTPIALRIANWLHNSSGYAILMDSYEPDYYRKAMFYNSITLSNIHNHAAKATVVFNCKPQRYFISGNVPVIFTASGTITNPTVFNSKPIIKVTGRGYETININDYVLYLSLINMNIGASTGITKMKVNANKFMQAIGESSDNSFIFTCYGNICSATVTSSSSSPITVEDIGPYTDDFIEKIGSNKLNDYYFVYHETDGGYWELNGETVNLSEYYITINGTPVDGDIITISVDAVWKLTSTTSAVPQEVDPRTYGVTFSGNPNLNDTMEVIPGSTITIDSEIMDCYDDTINKNDFVEFQNGFPELKSGENSIEFGENVTRVEVIPKWWTL